MAVFFRANAYFQIKTNVDMTTPDSPEFQELDKLELEGYEHAKKLRREILQEASSSTVRYSTVSKLTFISHTDLPKSRQAHEDSV